MAVNTSNFRRGEFRLRTKTEGHAILLSVLLAVLLSCQTGLTQELPRAKAEKTFQEGQREKSLDLRIAKYKKALSFDPSFQKAIYQIGVCYFRQGDYARSISYLSRVDSTQTHVRSYLGTALALQARHTAQAGDFEGAASDALHAIRVDATQAIAHATLGIARLRQGRIDAAIGQLKTALKYDAAQENAWLALADAHMQKKQFQRAADAYSAALRLDASSEHTRAELEKAKKMAAVADWSKQYEAAVKQDSLTKAIRILKTAYSRQPDSPRIAELILQAKDLQYYHAGLRALGNRRGPEAVQLLQRVKPGYEDVETRLKEAKSLSTSTTTQPKLEVASEKARAAVPHSSTSDTASGTPTKEKKVPSLHPVSHATTDSAAMRAIANEPLPQIAGRTPQGKVTVQDKPKANLIQQLGRYERADLASGLIWSGYFFCAAGLALLLVVLRPRKHVRQMPRKPVTPARSPSTRPAPPGLTVTQQLFEEELVSETLGFASGALEINPQETDKFEHEQRYDPRLIETKTLTRGSHEAGKIGRYRIDREIGKGSMGMVFKAWDPLLDRTVVIKNVTFAAFGRKRSVLRDRLYREASAAGKLNHPNIVTIHDVGEEKDFSYIVMEYLPGQTLRALMDMTGRIDLGRAVAIVRQVCMALEFAHRHDIVHRDIKPSNIILMANDIVKVADFGIAKMPKLETLSRAGDVVGTPFYMSPEQIEGRRLDGRSDIFSTGVLFYEMVTGCRPFEGENVPEIVYKIVHQSFQKASLINRSLPAYVDSLIASALAKDPHERFQSALELCNMLDEMKEEMLLT